MNTNKINTNEMDTDEMDPFSIIANSEKNNNLNNINNMNTNYKCTKVETVAIIVVEKRPADDISKEICNRIRDLPISIDDVKLFEYQEGGEDAFKEYLTKFQNLVVIGLGRGARYFIDSIDSDNYFMKFFVNPELNVLQNFKNYINAELIYLILSKSSEEEQKRQLYAPYLNQIKIEKYIADRPLSEMEVVEVIEKFVNEFIESYTQQYS